jgi:hypothetical protein
MGRISKMPYEVQGAYLRLCCIYWNKECNLSIEDAKLELSFVENAYDNLTHYGIVKLHEEHIQIEFLDEQYDTIMQRKAKLSKAGKKGVEAKLSKGKGKAKGRLRVTPADKIRVDKDKEIYITIEHLTLYQEEYDKLCNEWAKAQVDNILDAIGNYKGISKYKSLYLTARQWLKDKPKLTAEGGVRDEYAQNVMKQIEK